MHPFNPFLIFISYPYNKDSILFEFKINIFKFGRYPNIRVLKNKFALKFNSAMFGKCVLLKTSSKSLNLQFERSSSVISWGDCPHRRLYKISSVSLPVKRSFANYYSEASMEIPSKTLRCLIIKRVYIR